MSHAAQTLVTQPGSTAPSKPRKAVDETLLYDNKFSPVWPVVLSAWFDRELTTQELSSLREAAAPLEPHLPGLTQALSPWLDAEHPPSSAKLLRLSRSLKDLSFSIGFEAQQNPAETSVAFAKSKNLPQEATQTLLDIFDGFQVESEAAPSAEPSTLDISELRVFLDGANASTRRDVRALLEDHIFALPHELSKDEHRALVTRWLFEVARHGFSSLAYPGVTSNEPNLGGMLAVFETLAYFDLSLVVKFGVQFGLFGGAIYFLGSDEQRKELLPKIAQANMLGCFAMTETGHGSNVKSIETTATLSADTDEWVIQSNSPSGRKDYIGNAAQDGSFAVVFAQLMIGAENHGVHAFFVPLRDDSGAILPGISISDCGKKFGLNGVDNGRISFSNVKIPRTSLLSRFAQVEKGGHYESAIPNATKRFFKMLSTLVGGRIAISGASVSAMKTTLALALRYSVRRRQFGPSQGEESLLLDYPKHQQRLLLPLASAYAFHAAVEEVKRSFMQENPGRDLETLAAGVKALASRCAVDTARQCRESCGGQGYLSANRFADIVSDTEVFCTFEGDNTVLLQLVARNVLTDFQKTFLDGSAWGIARLAVQMLSNLTASLNPLTGWRWDEGHLQNSKMQLAALQYREEVLMREAASQVKHEIGRKVDPFIAFSRCQIVLEKLSIAWTEHQVLRAFVAFVERSPASSRQVLDRLCDLYALSRIEADLGWFLEKGYIESTKAGAIHLAVQHLCRDLRKDALSLVDAFSIPEKLLAAPMLSRL
jgi:acyl-CoA oxidase